MSDDAAGTTPPHPPRGSAAPSPSRGEGLTVSPNKNRLLQVRRTGSRKLFGKERKEVFLEWFAATCNVRLSAGKAGVHEKTVYKHLLKDAAFEEAFGRAVRLGYMRLEARQLQEAHRPVVEAGSAVRPTPAPPCQGGEEYEIGPSTSLGTNGCYGIRILDDAEAEEHFDPQLALQLLREHRRHVAGPAAPRKPGAAPQTASNEEIAEALAKRLKGFALRVSNQNNKS